MTITSRDEAIAQYDQNLAKYIATIKHLGPVSRVVLKRLVKTYEETRGEPGREYDNLVANMALLGLTTCMMAIDREMNDE